MKLTLQTKSDNSNEQLKASMPKALFSGLARKIDAAAKSSLNRNIDISNQADLSNLIFSYGKGKISSEIATAMAIRSKPEAGLVDTQISARRIKMFSELFSSDLMVEALSKYAPDTRSIIASSLWPVDLELCLHITQNSEWIKKMNRVQKIFYSDEVAKEVASLFETDNKIAAKEILERIVYLSEFTNEPAKIAGMLKFSKIAGKELFDIVDHDFSRMFYMAHNELYLMVSDKESASAITAYVSSIDYDYDSSKGLEDVKSFLPKPTLQNLAAYHGLVMGYFLDKYQIRQNLDWDAIFTLLPMDDQAVSRLAPMIDLYGLQKALELDRIFYFSRIDVNSVKEIANLIQIAKEENIREYTISSKNNAIKELTYSKKELLEYSVIAIVGSRSAEREKMAVEAISEIVGIEIINRAKTEFHKNHKALMNEIIGAVKKSDFEAAHEVLKRASNIYINDVLNSANYKEMSISNANFVRAAESKNPLDYDSSVQIACVYLPASRNISGYCKSDKVLLVKYDVGNKTIGSAICYIEGDKFLVDSVEGHRTFRKSELFEIVYQDLLKRASDRGMKTVIFYDAPNETPRMFKDHLIKKGVQSGKINMNLEIKDLYIEARNGAECHIVNLS